jgi:DNA polymerase-4/DNA polymerase V
VGLAPTKSLAKICSKLKKPHGFTAVKGSELHRFLKCVSTDQVCGFGPSSVALLAKNGIFTVHDYVMRPRDFAKRVLGKIGAELWHELRGESVYPIATGAAPDLASVSKTKTFTPATSDKAFVRAQVLRNLESAFIKLRRHKLRAKTLGISLRDNEFRSRSLGAELERATSSTMEVSSVVSRLFERVYDPRFQYRQSGVWIYNLEADCDEQGELFKDPCRLKSWRNISRCMDDVNEAYGKHCLHMASTHVVSGYGQHLGDRGDIAERKINLLKGETSRQRLNIPMWNLKV